MRASEVADMLVNYAKAYRKLQGPDSIKRNSHMNAYVGEAPSQELVDAVVVDFINFTMGRGVGMDLALYTSDIQPGVNKDG